MRSELFRIGGGLANLIRNKQKELAEKTGKEYSQVEVSELLANLRDPQIIIVEKKKKDDPFGF